MLILRLGTLRARVTCPSLRGGGEGLTTSQVTLRRVYVDEEMKQDAS